MTKTITSFSLSWYSAFYRVNWTEQSKLETVKMMGARSNAISLNVKINKRKSVDACGYKLAINVQNVMQKDSAQVKISSKVVGEGSYFFDSPCKMFGRQWTKEAKIAIFNDNTLIWRPIPGNPHEYLHKSYTARNYVPWAAFLSLRVYGYNG